MSKSNTLPQPTHEHLDDVASLLAKGIIRMRRFRQRAAKKHLINVPLKSDVCVRETGSKTQVLASEDKQTDLVRLAEENEA